MTVIRRITATVLATVGTVLGLLAAASVAAASPVSPNDGNGFPTSVPHPPKAVEYHVPTTEPVLKIGEQTPKDAPRSQPIRTSDPFGESCSSKRRPIVAAMV
jgi:hypothetical protein